GFSPPPFLPGHEFQTQPVIVDHQISAVVTPNCVGFNFLHFLSHHADIGCVIAPFVAEAIELKTVIESRQRHDDFFEPDDGPTSAAASTPSPTTATPSAATTVSTTGTVPSARTMACDPMPATAGTCVAAALFRRISTMADVVFRFWLFSMMRSF